MNRIRIAPSSPPCRAPGRPCCRPRVETLENRYAPGTVLLGQLTGVPWLGSVLDPDLADQAVQAQLDAPQLLVLESMPPVARAAAQALSPGQGPSPTSEVGAPLATNPGAGLDAGGGLNSWPGLGGIDGGDPLPIPGGFANPTGGAFVHAILPGPADQQPPYPPTSPQPLTNDPSTITDLNGHIGVSHLQGTGKDAGGKTLYYDVDIRFMSGVYQDVNGSQQHGTFAFL